VKVLLVHNRYRSASPSGENRVVDQEGAALAAAGHVVERFEKLSDDIEKFPLPQKAGVAVKTLWSPAASRELEGALARFRPDVVHVHNLFPLLSPSVLVGCRRQKVPAVVTFHNYRQVCPSGDMFRSGKVCSDCVGRFPLPALRHGCYKGSSLATFPLAVGVMAHRRAWQRLPSAYVFISKSQQELFATLQLPPERCFVKLNLVPPVPRKTSTQDLVAYVGRLNEAKGLRLLMRAWDNFSAGTGAGGSATGTGPLRLVIAGSGPLEDEVKSWASTRPSVDAVGLLGRDACAELVRTARAVVVPSEWLETFGLVVVEAMAAGVAVVAPAHASFPELVTDGVDGVLFPPGDAQALAAVLGRVATSPGYFDDLGAAGRATYEERFRPERNLAQLEEIYQFAIEHPSWLRQDRGSTDRSAIGT
jgi:glycosyltransferase involved in cell wall biosynthesis